MKIRIEPMKIYRLKTIFSNITKTILGKNLTEFGMLMGKRLFSWCHGNRFYNRKTFLSIRSIDNLLAHPILFFHLFTKTSSSVKKIDLNVISPLTSKSQCFLCSIDRKKENMHVSIPPPREIQPRG